MLLYNISITGVAGIPLSFILKDRLGLQPQQMSVLNFLTDIPYFLGFIFGFLRDRWRPFGKGDRGYFLFLPLLLAGTNLLLAFGAYSYGRILIAMLLMGAVRVWLGAAAQGLLTGIARYHGMTGRLAVVLLVTPRVINIAATAIGGHLADPAHQHLAFALSAALCLPMLAMAFWKPRAAFAHEDRLLVRAVPEGALAALARLARHRAIYLPAVILCLWAFAPGWGTPLFYFLTTKRGNSPALLMEDTYGNAMAVMGVGTLVSALAYSKLCCRVRLRPLLYGGTVLGVVGCPIFFLIHNVAQAYVISFLAGASLGIALCAFNDLLMRCCPQDLEGAALAFVGAMSTLAGDTSDIFGSWLYEKGGFGLALVVSTLFTGAILGVVPFIPRALTAPPEGEPFVEAVVSDAYPHNAVEERD